MICLFYESCHSLRHRLSSIGLDYINRPIHLTSLYQKEVRSLEVFDRRSKLLQRERAAILPDHHIFNYLKDEIAYRLVDRLQDISRDFKIALDLGCNKGFVSNNISFGNFEHFYLTEFSPGLLELASGPKDVKTTKGIVDEEFRLPFESNFFDVVLSNLNLHWINNLPGCCAEVFRILKEDGVFLASMFAGDTLYQLRSSFVLAELEREGGFAPHVSPFTEIRDLSGLLNQAGFTLLTIDTDEITVNYPSLFELMWDLKGMGESNASLSRKLHLHRDTMMAAAAVYQELYGNDDGSIPATYQVAYMIGWKPDPKKKAVVAERGSGEISLKDINKLNEMIREHGMEGRVKFLQEADQKNGEEEDNKKK